MRDRPEEAEGEPDVSYIVKEAIRSMTAEQLLIVGLLTPASTGRQRRIARLARDELAQREPGLRG